MPSNIDAIVADIRLAHRRLAIPGVFKTPEDAQREFFNNGYAAMEALGIELKKLSERLDGVIDEVDEIADAQGNFIDDELGQTIFTALAAGATLADELDRLAPGLDDVSKSRVVALASVFRQAAEVASMAITEAMGYDEGDEEEDEDDDAADDDAASEKGE